MSRSRTITWEDPVATAARAAEMRVLAEAHVVHRGSTVAIAEGRVFAEDSGKLVAHGTTTCLLFSSNGSASAEIPPRQSR
jgi:hypothetical protein